MKSLNSNKIRLVKLQSAHPLILAVYKFQNLLYQGYRECSVHESRADRLGCTVEDVCRGQVLSLTLFRATPLSLVFSSKINIGKFCSLHQSPLKPVDVVGSHHKSPVSMRMGFLCEE